MGPSQASTQASKNHFLWANEMQGKAPSPPTLEAWRVCWALLC